EIQACKKMKESEKIHKRMEEIVKNYVYANSVFEVNLGDTVRKEYIELVRKSDYNWNVESFKKLEIAVVQNISDTFSRFRKTVQYDVYLRMKKLAVENNFSEVKQ